MAQCTKSGFTLIELLVALVIITVIALVAIPSLADLIKFHRLSNTAEELFATVQRARSEAVRSNADVYLTFTTGDSWCYGLNASPGCDCNTAGSCTLGAVSAAGAGQISLTQSGFSSNTVIFDKSHASASAAGSVTLTLYGRSELIRINISRMGNITLCSTGVSGYTAC